MECPNCKYEHGWNGEKQECVDGDSGEFYILAIEMERKSKYSIFEKEHAKLYGCPVCGITFIS